MAFVKHPELGNKHVDDSEVAALVAQGWVQWPRKKEEKELGDGSDAAYWRKKYERELQAKPVEPEVIPTDEEQFGSVEVFAEKPRNKPGPKPKV